jgi:hypothetical protein
MSFKETISKVLRDPTHVLAVFRLSFRIQLWNLFAPLSKSDKTSSICVSAENEDKKEYMVVFCAFPKHEISKISGPVSDVSARRMA